MRLNPSNRLTALGLVSLLALSSGGLTGCGALNSLVAGLTNGGGGIGGSSSSSESADKLTRMEGFHAKSIKVTEAPADAKKFEDAADYYRITQMYGRDLLANDGAECGSESKCAEVDKLMGENAVGYNAFMTSAVEQWLASDRDVARMNLIVDWLLMCQEYPGVIEGMPMDEWFGAFADAKAAAQVAEWKDAGGVKDWVEAEDEGVCFFTSKAAKNEEDIQHLDRYWAKNDGRIYVRCVLPQELGTYDRDDVDYLNLTVWGRDWGRNRTWTSISYYLNVEGQPSGRTIAFDFPASVLKKKAAKAAGKSADIFGPYLMVRASYITPWISGQQNFWDQGGNLVSQDIWQYPSRAYGTFFYNGES